MFVYDGNLKTITEVPTGTSVFTSYDVKRDLWSRGQDFLALNPWSTIPWFISGGSSRGLDTSGNETFQNADFTLNALEGWRIILADYPHEMKLIGNIVSNDQGLLFDFSNQTLPGAYPVIQGAADLLTYIVNSDGSTSVPDVTRAEFIDHHFEINEVEVSHTETQLELFMDSDVHCQVDIKSIEMGLPESNAIGWEMCNGRLK